MNDKLKLLIALLQIENLSLLLFDNEEKGYFYEKLLSMKIEIERQLEMINRM